MSDFQVQKLGKKNIERRRQLRWKWFTRRNIRRDVGEQKRERGTEFQRHWQTCKKHQLTQKQIDNDSEKRRKGERWVDVKQKSKMENK